jgi:magnesium-transporting ATPase (P-type)
MNLALNGLNGGALSFESGEAELMMVPPRKTTDALIAGKRMIMLVVHTTLLLAAMLLNFLIGLSVQRRSPSQAAKVRDRMPCHDRCSRAHFHVSCACMYAGGGSRDLL